MRDVLTPNDRRTWLDRAVDAVDAAIYTVAPRWGAKRMATRVVWRHSKQRLDQITNHISRGKEDDEFHQGNWLASHLSPDSALERRLDELRLKSRELYETDAFACGAVESLITQVVGTGLRYQSRIRAKAGVISAEQAKQLNSRLEETAKRQFARIDTTFTQTLKDVQVQAVRSYAVDGEAFIRRTSRRTEDRPLPLTLEVIDADRVQTPPELVGNPLVRMGIERDRTGKVVRYHFRTKNPYDTIDNEYRWDSCDAEDMIHWFEKLWPSQSRGVPWFAPVMTKIKDMGDYCEAALIGRQVRACYAFFVKTLGDPDDIANAQSKGKRDRSGKRKQTVTPGEITYLRDGEEADGFGPSGDDDLPGYMEWQLRAVAAGLNFPYELLAKDYTRTTMSAGRLSLIDGRTGFCRRQQSMTDKMLLRISCWMVDEYFVAEATSIKALGISLAAWNNDPWPFYSANWIPPGWPWIDPEKDIEASRGALAIDLTTDSLELASRGLDLEETHEVRIEEKLLKLADWARLRKFALENGIPDAEIPLALGMGGKTATANAVGQSKSSSDQNASNLATAA